MNNEKMRVKLWLGGLTLFAVIAGGIWLWWQKSQSYEQQQPTSTPSLPSASTSADVQSESSLDNVLRSSLCPLASDATEDRPLFRCPLTSRYELLFVREGKNKDGANIYTARLRNLTNQRESILWGDESLCWSDCNNTVHNSYELRLWGSRILAATRSLPVIGGNHQIILFIDLVKEKKYATAITATNAGLGADEANLQTVCGLPLTYDYGSFLAIQQDRGCSDFLLEKNERGDIVGILQNGVRVKRLDPPWRFEDQTRKDDFDFLDIPSFDNIIVDVDGSRVSFFLKAINFTWEKFTFSLEKP